MSAAVIISYVYQGRGKGDNGRGKGGKKVCKQTFLSLSLYKYIDMCSRTYSSVSEKGKGGAEWRRTGVCLRAKKESAEGIVVVYYTRAQ